MKTKEEIMIEYCTPDGVLNLNMGKKILQAMESYANEVSAQKVQEERKRIEKWLMENSYCTNSKELLQFLFQQPEAEKVQEEKNCVTCNNVNSKGNCQYCENFENWQPLPKPPQK